MKTFFNNYWKTLSWAIIIAILLFTSGDNLPKNNILKINHLDKYAHFILFLGLEILILIESRTKKRNVNLTNILIIVFLPIIYAAITELIQLYFIFDRDGSWQDFIADIIGIIVGIIIYILYARRTINLFRY